MATLTKRLDKGSPLTHAEGDANLTYFVDEIARLDALIDTLEADHPVDLTSDVTGDLPFTNLAQIKANSILLNDGTGTADVSAHAVGDLTDGGTPGTGDFVVGFLAAGGLRKFDVGNLPGGVDTTGTPGANEYARFTDSDTLEGRTAAQVRSDLSVADISGTPSTGDYARWADSDTLEARTVAQVRSDLSVADVSGTPAATAFGALPIAVFSDADTLQGSQHAYLNESLDTFTMFNTDASTANSGPFVTLRRDVTGASGRPLGLVTFFGQDDGGALQTYGHVYAKSNNASAGSEEGEMGIRVAKGGSAGSGDSDIRFKIVGSLAQLVNGSTLFMEEVSAAQADTAGQGQFWVKDDAPNTPWFTNDTGTDAEIAVLDGVLQDLDTLGAASTDGEFIVATGAGAFAYESGATARTSLGLTIGTDVQAQDAFLQDIADLTDPGADRLLGWDDSAGAVAFFTLGNGLSFGDATLAADTASTSVDGVVELATIAEVDTGTDTARAITPDALAGSDHGKEVIGLLVFDDSEDVATGDGAGDVFVRIPAKIAGWNLVDVEAAVQTAGTTGTTDIQIHNVTDAADMLSTKITIDSTETDSSTAATPPVIDTAADDVAAADILRIDVDAVSSTAPKGLWVELTFQAP